jgi:hypothetical protein
MFQYALDRALLVRIAVLSSNRFVGNGCGAPYPKGKGHCTPDRRQVSERIFRSCGTCELHPDRARCGLSVGWGGGGGAAAARRGNQLGHPPVVREQCLQVQGAQPGPQAWEIKCGAAAGMLVRLAHTRQASKTVAVPRAGSDRGTAGADSLGGGGREDAAAEDARGSGGALLGHWGSGKEGGSCQRRPSEWRGALERARPVDVRLAVCAPRHHAKSWMRRSISRRQNGQWAHRTLQRAHARWPQPSAVSRGRAQQTSHSPSGPSGHDAAAAGSWEWRSGGGPAVSASRRPGCGCRMPCVPPRTSTSTPHAWELSSALEGKQRRTSPSDEHSTSGLVRAALPAAAPQLAASAVLAAAAAAAACSCCRSM